MSEAPYYVLTVAERTGHRTWDGPFTDENRAESARSMLIDRERSFLVRRVTDEERDAQAEQAAGAVHGGVSDPVDNYQTGTMHHVAPVNPYEIDKTQDLVDDLTVLIILDDAKNLHEHSHGHNGEFGQCTRVECVAARALGDS